MIIIIIIIQYYYYSFSSFLLFFFSLSPKLRRKRNGFGANLAGFNVSVDGRENFGGLRRVKFIGNGFSTLVPFLFLVGEAIFRKMLIDKIKIL